MAQSSAAITLMATHHSNRATLRDTNGFSPDD
jgi:hypothetical protein